MNVAPHTLSLRRRSQARPLFLAALVLLSSAVASAQTVQINTGGIVSITGVPPIYNDRYVMQKTDFGFLYLDTVALQGGLVQVEAKCGTGQPTPLTNIYVIGDCNGITSVDTAGTRVVARQLSGQCGAATFGCGGGSTNGTGFFEFKLGTWEYVGPTTQDILSPSTQTTDLAGRTWKVTAAGDGKNFTWQASGNSNAPPTASASATNLSAANRTDKTNYYGDQWQLKDTSATVSPLTEVDWDLLYNGTYTKDEGGPPSSEGTITGFFPCDPKGPVAGDIRFGTNCIQSLGLTNPPASGSYRFAEQSANANGISTNTFVSSFIAVQCAQPNIVGYTGATGTCAKTGGTLNVLVGGVADASATQGNPIQFNWTFPGTATPNVSGMTPGVPAGATTFTLTVTYPGGYQSTASGNVVQASLVAAFSVVPNPVLINTPLTLTNNMQKATGATLNSVDYLFNPGACTTPPPIGTNPVGGTFLNVGGTATITAPAAKGDFCLYLKYSYTPPSGPAQSQTVSASVTTTDWVASPQILINPSVFCFGPCSLAIGTTYSLSDNENIPLNPHPPAAWDLNGTSIGTSPDANTPITWTPTSPCSSCTLRVTVNGSSATLPVNISSAQPTPVPTPPGPTPTPPIVGGSLSVSVTGPSSGAKNTPLQFTANASGGSGGYSYFWQCDYNPLGSFAALGQTATCTYATSGAHTVVAMVRDSAGSSTVSPGVSVTISGVGTPSVQNTLSGSGVTQNVFNGRWTAPTSTPITFSANEANAATWTWAFGDGQTATGRTATHSYSASGPYAATLTVTGDEVNTSGTGSATINIDISGPPGPSAAFTVTGATALGTDSYEVEAFSTMTFTATETKANSYAWDFGDGTATGKTVTHAFSTSGSHTATLTVTGDGTTTIGTRSGNATFTVDPVKFRAIIVPGAAHLDLGADVWGTDVTVSNPGTGNLTISPAFVAYSDSGGDVPDLSQVSYDPKLTFQLVPGASWSQVDVVKFLNGGSNKGTLVFKYDGSADPIVTARVYFAAASDPQGASYGAAFPSYKVTGGGVSTQEVSQAVTNDQTIIGLLSNTLYRFRVTLYNADSRAGTFRLVAFDQAGNPQFIKDATGQYVGYRDFKIGGYQQSAPSDDDLGLKDSSMRYVLKASRAPGSTFGTLIASGTALDRKTSDLVQITDDTPLTQAESGVISYYVAGASHLDTTRAQWRTDLRIFNKSSNARTLGFEYYFTHGAGGAEQKAQVVGITIPGNGLLTYDDLVDSLMKRDTTVDLSGDTAGMLRIFHFEDSDSATKPLVISSRNYDDPSDGTGTAGTQLGVYSSLQTSKPGNAPLLVAGAEDSDRFYSVIGLFALDPGVTTGKISAIGPDGNEVGSFDFGLNQNAQGGAGHFGQIFLRSLSGWNNPDAPVTIKVTVTSGGRVGAYAVTVDLKTNDLTFIQGRPQF